MRIISGRFRGHPLTSFKADHIRPTTDRVKESIFNKLQTEFHEEARVLDLYSGTGNLAIEALSRGAGYVEAVELSKKSIAIIQENIAKLGIKKDEIRVVSADVLKYLRRYSGPGYDVIFADPPFTEKLADATMQEIAKSAVVKDSTVIVIESSRHEVIRDGYESLVRFDHRDYGDKICSFFRRSAE